MRKICVLLLIFACASFFYGVSIEIKKPDPEFIVKEDHLQIICPKCGAVLYHMNTDEVFHGDNSRNYQYISADPSLPDISNWSESCPFCGTAVTYEVPCDIDPDGWCTRFYSNKGWMPRRKRP